MSDIVQRSNSFIGREKELTEFRSLLSDPDNKTWIINIFDKSEDKGGVGKTWLLEQFRNIVLNEYPDYLVNERFVDFYFTVNRLEFGILRNLAFQLGWDHFTSFKETLERYDERHSGTTPLLPEEQQELRNLVINRFVECYQALSGLHSFVLLLDTAEEAGEASNEFWQSILPRLKGNSIVVVAGREKVPFANIKEEVKYLPLENFTLAETIEYFRARGLDEDDLPDTVIKEIWQRTEGQPIITALTAEWLGQHPVNELLNEPGESFKLWFTLNVCDVGTFEENQTILFMAHVWHRFNSKILAHLTEQDLITSQRIIDKLKGLSFIKYRIGQMGMAESCLLHDKMRDLVKEFLWPLRDRDGILAQELSEKMASYYEQLLSEAKDKFEQQILTSEQLYYQLDADLDVGFIAATQLFREKMQAHDIGFCEAINNELQRHASSLPPYEQLEYLYFQGWVALRRENNAKAIDLWEMILKHEDASKLLRARTLTQLVEAHADNSEFSIAEEYGKVAQGLFTILPDNERSSGEVGLLYNNMGYMYRRQDLWSKAIQYYDRALEEGGPKWLQARIRNNLGFVLHLLGRSELAFSHCETARRIREKLDLPYELGLSYNTLGILYVEAMRIPEAESYFHKAIVEFDNAHSRYGRSMVDRALGRLYRQYGWYEEHVVGEPFDQERDKYKKALEYLQEAVEISKERADEAGLAEALAELGCTYRERREWKKAIDSLDTALEYARGKSLQRKGVDILQDISMVYWRQYKFGHQERAALDKAEEYARHAEKEAQASDFHYLLSKAQWSLGDVLFEKEQYREAFRQYVEACINITQLDPQAMGHDSAKKALHYEDLVDHVEEQITRLPNAESAKDAQDILVNRWLSSRVVSEYPGFIRRIQAVTKNYELLNETEEGD